MKLLKLSDLTHFWGNVRKHIPTKTSDLTNDSNFAVDSNVLHKSGDETVAGVKTFSDNLLIYSSDNSVDAPRLNIKTSKYVKGDTTNTDTMRINFLDASGNSVASVYANKNTSGTQYLSFQVYTTDNNNANITSTINYYISKNGDKYFLPYEDNQISLGGTVRRWKSVYSTNYYYGSDNVEFSTKFVTSDTNQTISGVKSFSNNTYITSLNSTNEVASPSSSSSSVMPIINTITYTSGDTSVVARLNFRVTATGDKSLFPHENNQYYLGLTSRKWKEIHATAYYYGSSDTEFSTKFVTSDSAQTITERKTFTKNVTIKNEDVTIGSTSGAGSKDLTFTDSADNALAKITANKVSNGSSSIAFRVDTTDSNDANINSQFQFFIAKSGVKVINPTLDNDISLGRTSNRWKDTCTCLINGLEPSALSMPDLANGIDISSYLINIGTSTPSEYTPSVNGWLVLKIASTQGYVSIRVSSTNGIDNYVYSERSDAGGLATDGGYTYEKFTSCITPCIKNDKLDIYILPSLASVVSAYFYPCLGNV